jgi:hypothetical protein
LSGAESDLRGELVSLERFPDWDERIEAFPQKRIFHEAAWLRFLAKDQNGEAVVLRVGDRQNAERALWPGLVVRKGPIRIFGSPLRGWGTVVMGPLSHGEDAQALVGAAEAAFARAGIRHWEFVTEAPLPPAGGVGSSYRFESSYTHRIALHSDENAMWASLQQRCRTSVRKAIKRGLSCRLARAGDFVEPLHRFVAEIFARQKSTPPYDAARLRRLWDAMFPLGKAVGLEVWLGERMAAAGLFIADHRQAYAWSEASDSEFNSLGPNNLLYWEAMRHFGARGLSFLHLPGAPGSPIGKFKASFNPEILAYPFWILDRDPFLRWARRAYERMYFLRAKWRYLRSRGTGPRPGERRGA